MVQKTCSRNILNYLKAIKLAIQATHRVLLSTIQLLPWS